MSLKSILSMTVIQLCIDDVNISLSLPLLIKYECLLLLFPPSLPQALQ